MRTILIFTFLAFRLSATAQVSEDERHCIRQENLAQKDMYNDEMKYYSFGITGGHDKHSQALAQILMEQYHIEVRHEGCIMLPGYECYNNMVEQIAKRKYGDDFWQQVEQKTDSLLMADTKQLR